MSYDRSMRVFTVEEEKKVIQTLVQFGETKDPRGDAFHAVDRAMKSANWTTPDTMGCVKSLEARKLLHLEPVVAKGNTFVGISVWKEGAL